MYKFPRLVVYIFLLSITVIVNGHNLTEVFVNIGRNLTLKCPIHHTRDVMWVREDGKVRQYTHKVLDDGSLFIPNVDRNDSGMYACNRENVVNSDVKARINVTVRTPPPALVNVVVRPSTILALLLWDVAGDGGYPIINFTAQYRLAYANESWIPISPNHITPNSRQIEVYKLVPNTTYQFRIWATNQLGKGMITEVYGKTLDVYLEQELARHLFDGAEKFDTRVWAVAVGVVMGTLILLGLGTCILLYRECRVPGENDFAVEATTSANVMPPCNVTKVEPVVVCATLCAVLHTKVVPLYAGVIFLVFVTEEQEVIELVPNIILNPGFDPQNQSDLVPDENSNSETPLRLNNNTVVQPHNTQIGFIL